MLKIWLDKAIFMNWSPDLISGKGTPKNTQPSRKKITFDYAGDRGNYDEGNINEYKNIKKTYFNTPPKNHPSNQNSEFNRRAGGGQQKNNDKSKKNNNKENSIQNSKSVDSIPRYVPPIPRRADNNTNSKPIKNSESIDQMSNRKNYQDHRNKNNRRNNSNARNSPNTNAGNENQGKYQPPYKRTGADQIASETEWQPTFSKS